MNNTTENLEQALEAQDWPPVYPYRDREWLRYHGLGVPREPPAVPINMLQERGGDMGTVHHMRRRDSWWSPRFALYKDREWLRVRYQDRCMTQADIASEAGCSQRTIGHWLRHHHIPLRTFHGGGQPGGLHWVYVGLDGPLSAAVEYLRAGDEPIPDVIHRLLASHPAVRQYQDDTSAAAWTGDPMLTRQLVAATRASRQGADAELEQAIWAALAAAGEGELLST